MNERRQQSVAIPHPTTDDRDEWRGYWEAQGMSWRTEPEIGAERQLYLAERRIVQPQMEKGVYPFGGVTLNRADVEWLLATHESEGVIGPIDWNDIPQRSREGLDLRGAILQGVYLAGLPLARLHAGPTYEERARTPLHMRDFAVARLDAADISAAHLEQASLGRVHFEEAILREVHLSGADLFRAHLEGATLTGAYLDGADLRFAFFDTAAYLSRVVLIADDTGPAWLAGIRWQGADLSFVDWSQLREVGDEYWAHQPRDNKGKSKSREARLEDYQVAVRTNRQLSAILRDQGLNEDANHFAYRAQRCQRVVLRRQRRFLRYFGSLLLDLSSGYGYKPIRSLIAYVIIVCLFAGAYLINAQFAAPHLTWDEALVLSVSAFHGRGFFTSGIRLGDTLARVAALEAIIGLLIEITFIATFTQRFFAR